MTEKTHTAKVGARAPEAQLAALRAALRAKGHTLHPLPDGGYMVAAWGYSRTFASLAEVQAFARKIRGAA